MQIDIHMRLHIEHQRLPGSWSASLKKRRPDYTQPSTLKRDQLADSQAEISAARPGSFLRQGAELKDIVRVTNFRIDAFFTEGKRDN